MDFKKLYRITFRRPFFNNVKHNWKVFYYKYNLTESVEERYVTKILAIARGLWINRRTGFKVWVKEI
jgi:hypothetical protein